MPKRRRPAGQRRIRSMFPLMIAFLSSSLLIEPPPEAVDRSPHSRVCRWTSRSLACWFVFTRSPSGVLPPVTASRSASSSGIVSLS
jgi:hypothetical protein